MEIIDHLEYLEPLREDKNENVKKTVDTAINKLGDHEEPKVPEWNITGADLNSAPLKQREFYEKWLHEFNRGNYIDIEGNLSYIFGHLYVLNNKLIEDKDLTSFLGKL